MVKANQLEFNVVCTQFGHNKHMVKVNELELIRIRIQLILIQLMVKVNELEFNPICLEFDGNKHMAKANKLELIQIFLQFIQIQLQKKANHPMEIQDRQQLVLNYS